MEVSNEDGVDARRPLRIAIEGCGHGTLHSIYASVAQSCKVKGWEGVDLLIIGGDFQAVRNPQDLSCMSVPIKYRELGDFHEYYSGARTAPYLTIFVGGNHEASNYLFELYYGGWAAPNIYYLGAANVVSLGGVRIAGLSGIWKGFDYRKPHCERVPYNDNDVKSAYHVRELDVRKLLLLRSQVNIGISHDWPKGVEWKGDWKTLFRRKSHFEDDARTGRLGSEAAKRVMDRLRPEYWFSAHLHIKYSAIISHNQESVAICNGVPSKAELHAALTSASEPMNNEEEIDLDLDEDVEQDRNGKTQNNQGVVLDIENSAPQDALIKQNAVDAVPEDVRSQIPASFARPVQPTQPQRLPPPDAIVNNTTRFLALDKCLPNRDFLQLLEIPRASIASAESSEAPSLEYDAEWMAITRAIQLVDPIYLIVGDRTAEVPRDLGDVAYQPMIAEAREWIKQNVSDLKIPMNFVQTAPPWDNVQGDWRQIKDAPREYPNPQTAQFCKLLGIPNVFEMSEEEARLRLERGPAPNAERSDSGRGGWRGGRAGRGRGGGRGGGYRGGSRGRGYQWR